MNGGESASLVLQILCLASSAMHKPSAEMPDCVCECAAGGGKTMPLFTATIKICDCECECDCYCCIEQFYSTIADDPRRLQKMDNIQFFHTPLHEAAAEGNITLAVEIMNLMPSLGKKLNPEGLSPLHIAVEKGKSDLALALVKFDKQLVRIKGKGGLTPLHQAAAHKPDDISQLELLARLLVECPDSIGVLNNRLQSAVHVALENHNVESARLLVNWLIIVAKETDLSIKDSKGNTTLHVAARHCRSKDLLKFLAKLVKVDKANNYGETALDIAIRHGNREAIEMLRNAGAMNRRESAEDPHPPKKISSMVRYLHGNHADKWAEILTRAYYFLTKELTMDMRNTILVVAVLIATATYQGVLQPPGGVYSAEGSGSATNRLGPARRLGDGDGNQMHPPGRMVMGTTKYSYFMPTNTLAFISSTLIIIFVLPDRAFVMILQACLMFMCISYLLALNFISYYNSFSKILDIVCGCTITIGFLMKLGYYFVKAYYNEDEWLLRRLGVKISNHIPRCTRKHKDSGTTMSFLTRMRKQYKLISKRSE